MTILTCFLETQNFYIERNLMKVLFILLKAGTAYSQPTWSFFLRTSGDRSLPTCFLGSTFILLRVIQIFRLF